MQAIKHASDSVLGLPTQCLVARHAGVGAGSAVRGRLQYCTNVAFKINAKLGGTNCKLLGEPALWMPLMRGKPFMVGGRPAPPPAPALARLAALHAPRLLRPECGPGLLCPPPLGACLRLCMWRGLPGQRVLRACPCVWRLGPLGAVSLAAPRGLLH
jgi:hypothetical protein